MMGMEAAIECPRCHRPSQEVDCACAALRRSDGDGHTASTLDGTPCCLLTWVEGKPANKVIASGVADETVLREIGCGLSKLHCVSVGEVGQFRTYMQVGLYDLHANDQLSEAREAQASVRGLRDGDAGVQGHTCPCRFRQPCSP